MRPFFLLPCYMGSHTPSSKDLSPFLCVCVGGGGGGGIGEWWKIAFQQGFRSLPHSPEPEALSHVN